MSRRDFLRLVSGAAATGLVAALPGATSTGCRPPRPPPSPPPRSRGPIRAIAFDLFTIFDPRSITHAVERVVPDRAAALVDAWRARQFDYAFIRTAAGQYRDFHAITGDALVTATAQCGCPLDDATRAALVDAYAHLSPWPDAIAALHRLRDAGLALAPLANFTPAMIATLLGSAGITGLFDHQLSTDAVRTFKPDPRAYQLGVDAFGVPREQIAFAAFGGWDAAGATWFGYPTFWVNRLGVPMETLVTPTATGRGLDELAAWALA